MTDDMIDDEIIPVSQIVSDALSAISDSLRDIFNADTDGTARACWSCRTKGNAHCRGGGGGWPIDRRLTSCKCKCTQKMCFTPGCRRKVIELSDTARLYLPPNCCAEHYPPAVDYAINLFRLRKFKTTHSEWVDGVADLLELAGLVKKTRNMRDVLAERHLDATLELDKKREAQVRKAAKALQDRLQEI